MQTRILNLPDALKLSTILGKYIQKFPNPDTTTVMEFLDPIFEKIIPTDFQNCMELFMGDKLDKTITGDKSIELFFQGIEKNKIISLLMTSKELGFI